jgi:hypothetical protein
MSAYAWMEPALARIEADPLARRIAVGARPALACAARQAGVTIARWARSRGTTTAEAALRAEGVAVRESAEEPAAGPFLHHALYTAPPPRVTLFVRTLEALDQRLDATGLRARLDGVGVREIVLAHELFHHLAATTPMPAAVRPEVDILSIGPWRRRGAVRAAEEIAAAGFAAAWCGVDDAPALLDAVTLEIHADTIRPPTGDVRRCYPLRQP